MDGNRALKWLRANGPLALAYVLVGLVYTALFYLSFNGIAAYTNAHHFFPEPWGGVAMAVVVECSILFAFLVFGRSPIYAGCMLAAFAFTSYWLQRLHGELVAHGPESLHPNLVTAIVPFALVVMGIALHRIQPAKPDTERTFAVTEREEHTTTVERVERATVTGTAQARAIELLRAEPELSTKAVAARLQISDRTVRLAKAAMNGGQDGHHSAS